MTSPTSVALSKSKYMAGLQCHKRLWLEVNDPGAPELTPDAALQDRFAEGQRVTAKAREHFPGGVLIEGISNRHRLAATQAALLRGATVLHEAMFEHDGTAVRVDTLEKRAGRWALVEVKSSNELKPEHIPDVAAQLHVLRGAGLDVARVELMHLNRECRYPDLSNLFVSEDVTEAVEPLLPEVQANLDEYVAMLEGPVPDVSAGPHCKKPNDCPFVSRCCETPELHSIETLAGARATRKERLIAAGYRSVAELPDSEKLNAVQLRQRAAAQRGGLVVEPTLGACLDALAYPIAFLDFETVSPAIPVWSGCGPWNQIPVQVSVHTLHADGSLTHGEWLAEGPGDPREEMARQLVRLTTGAPTVLVYSGFENARISGLIEALPHHKHELEDLRIRLVDMLPLVRDNVYAPEFRGSFSIKAVLPALVPAYGYDGLEIRDGGTASATLKNLLIYGFVPAPEQPAVRIALLAYCHQDTLAMVRILQRLRELA